MTDRIFIKDLLVRCVLGLSAEERREKQDVLINVVLFSDLAKAGKSKGAFHPNLAGGGKGGDGKKNLDPIVAREYPFTYKNHGHTGLVLSAHGSSFITIEGNTGPPAGTSSPSDSVWVASHSRDASDGTYFFVRFDV